MTRLLLGACVLTFGLAFGLTGCDGVGTSPGDIESDTTGTSAFRPSPKAPSDINSSFKRVAQGDTLTIPVDSVANEPDSTEGSGPLQFKSVSVSNSSLADVSFRDGKTEAELVAALDTTGDVEMTFRPAYGDFESTEAGSLSVTIQEGNQAPEASYTFSPQSPEVGEEVTFDASGSSDDGTIESYEWDFNDDGSFEASGQTATNTFESSGGKQVTLRVTDDDGVTDDTTRTVDVGPRAVNDTLDTGEDEKLSVDSPGVLENDKGENLSVSAVAGESGNVGDTTELSSGALLTLMQNGGFTYDPNGAFNFLTGHQDSTDTFTYQASVDNGSDQADVTVMIKGANDPPEIDTLAGLTVDSADTATITTDSLSASDPDDPPSKLTYEVKEDPENGRLVKNQTSGVEEFKQENLINEEVRYIHDGSVGNTDNDSFKFELSDDDGDGPDVMTFEIVVKSEGDG